MLEIKSIFDLKWALNKKHITVFGFLKKLLGLGQVAQKDLDTGFDLTQ